jgi:hypothetical protein
MLDLLDDSSFDWLYPIYVPSYSRAATAPLLEMLGHSAPKEVQDLVYIVARASEAKAYRHAYPWATVVEQRVPWGIGPARMEALRDADERGFKRIVMLDDDITKVGLLEDRTRPGDTSPRSGRYSHKDTAWDRVEFTLRCLALGCKMADAVFYHAEDVAYGSTRSAFMSHTEDVDVTATIDKGGFPLCVLFIDLERFDMRHMPKAFQYEGEDLAMYLHAYDQGYSTFLFNTLVFDDDRGIASTIPFSGDGEVDRTGNLVAAQKKYEILGPYLKVTNRNPDTGAVKRITVDWRRYHKDYGTDATVIPTAHVVSFIVGGE